MEEKHVMLCELPKVDELLLDEQLIFVTQYTGKRTDDTLGRIGEEIPRSVVVDAVREVIQKARKEILAGERMVVPSRTSFIEDVCDLLKRENHHSLNQLVNATGVILHTNLGRANLSRAAVESVYHIAGSYSNLEYDVKKGTRGSRHDHVEKIIEKITGAEAAMVVNNNAAATMLCLSALTCGKEVIVSRGELVEIGGSFRIPDIMEQSGAYIKEVGTTNKTKISDYENAYHSERTGALMKVHTSNYKIVGFTQEAELSELVDLGGRLSLPVIYDMGSGLMLNLSHYGVNEPTVIDALKCGADVVLFSGDKLLGGPQGGVIIGKQEYIEKMKKHPLARVLRVDKMTLAAMEATFYEYLDIEGAKKKIPVLQMITQTKKDLLKKAETLKKCLELQATNLQFEIMDCEDQIGGGSAPLTLLPGYAIAVSGAGVPVDQLETLLRKAKTPVIVRVYHNKVLLSVRTIDEEEFKCVAETFSYAASCLMREGD